MADDDPRTAKGEWNERVAADERCARERALDTRERAGLKNMLSRKAE